MTGFRTVQQYRETFSVNQTDHYLFWRKASYLTEYSIKWPGKLTFSIIKTALKYASTNNILLNTCNYRYSQQHLQKKKLGFYKELWSVLQNV